MAYTPPRTFTDGQALTADDVKTNDDALVVYLHEGIVAGDLDTTSWIETRHIQAPIQDPITGVQHGVTGFQGSQWDGGALVRCQFGSALLTGKRYGSSTETFEVIPQTTFGVALRRTSTVVFHWWMESMNGPDNGPRSKGADAYMYVTEYRSGGLLTGTGVKSVTQTNVLEAINNQGYNENPPGGAETPYSLLGYGNMAGTKVFSATDYLAVGLAHLSEIDRSAIVNWGIALEVYYL